MFTKILGFYQQFENSTANCGGESDSLASKNSKEGPKALFVKCVFAKIIVEVVQDQELLGARCEMIGSQEFCKHGIKQVI